MKPKSGIVTDAAHSMKNGVTLYRALDLSTGQELFNINLGNQTVNVGEFLGVVHAIKYIIENDYVPKIIYTDSLTAISWLKNKKTASKKQSLDLLKSEVFLKSISSYVDNIKVIHWDKNKWGEIPADFGNKRH